MHSLKMATTKFVPICRGIQGTIGSLVVDPNYTPEEVSVPIDTLIVHITNNDDIGGTEGDTFEAAEI